jgi:flagellar basal-body rod protein FlgC
MGEAGAAGVQGAQGRSRADAGRRCTTPTIPGRRQGYVTQSNVNPVEEMVNMISASRSYQNNVEVMNTAKSLLLKTLQMGQ